MASKAHRIAMRDDPLYAEAHKVVVAINDTHMALCNHFNQDVGESYSFGNITLKCSPEMFGRVKLIQSELKKALKVAQKHRNTFRTNTESANYMK